MNSADGGRAAHARAAASKSTPSRSLVQRPVPLATGIVATDGRLAPGPWGPGTPRPPASNLATAWRTRATSPCGLKLTICNACACAANRNPATSAVVAGHSSKCWLLFCHFCLQGAVRRDRCTAHAPRAHLCRPGMSSAAPGGRCPTYLRAISWRCLPSNEAPGSAAGGGGRTPSAADQAGLTTASPPNGLRSGAGSTPSSPSRCGPTADVQPDPGAVQHAVQGDLLACQMPWASSLWRW